MSIFDKKNLEELERDLESADVMKIVVSDDGIVYANGAAIGAMKKEDAVQFNKLITAIEED